MGCVSYDCWSGWQLEIGMDKKVGEKIWNLVRVLEDMRKKVEEKEMEDIYASYIFYSEGGNFGSFELEGVRYTLIYVYGEWSWKIEYIKVEW